MNQYFERAVTVPWNPAVGFIKRTVLSSIRAFVVEETTEEMPLPHQYAIEGDKVYVVNLSGYFPVVDRPLALVVADMATETVASTSIAMPPFTEKTLHQFLVLRDDSSCWLLHDETSRDHSLIKCDSSGAIIWSEMAAGIDHYQGERVEVFELSDSLLVIKYFRDDIAFEKWDAGNGGKLEAWREPKATDRLYQVQGAEFAGISHVSQQQAKALLAYNVSTRQTSSRLLDNQYYGWFHQLIGIDRNRILYLAFGSSLAKYSLEKGIIHEIDVKRDIEDNLGGRRPDYIVWKIDKEGNLYFPYAEEAGLSIMKVQL